VTFKQTQKFSRLLKWRTMCVGFISSHSHTYNRTWWCCPVRLPSNTRSQECVL